MKRESSYWKVNKDSTVTIVIAAYLRHKPLNVALKSIYKQTYKQWQALVIADCCETTFKDNIDLSDERVKYINLPMRCGNQYGPNSVGIHLADTEYIAFLNHDDLWLSDHLETAINSLKENDADFFMGKAAFCHYRNQKVNSDEKGRLVFSEINRPETIWRCLTGPNSLFEPASSWVIKNELSKKIGYWNKPDSLLITPVMNWIQRGAKEKARFCYSNKPTTLKFNLHQVNNNDVPIYHISDPFIGLVEQFTSIDPETVRQFIAEDLKEALSRKLVSRKELREPFIITPAEKRLQDKYQDFVESIKDNNQAANSNNNNNIDAQWVSVITRRTGETFDQFVAPEIVIRELIKLNQIENVSK